MPQLTPDMVPALGLPAFLAREVEAVADPAPPAGAAPSEAVAVLLRATRHVALPDRFGVGGVERVAARWATGRYVDDDDVATLLDVLGQVATERTAAGALDTHEAATAGADPARPVRPLTVHEDGRIDGYIVAEWPEWLTALGLPAHLAAAVHDITRATVHATVDRDVAILLSAVREADPDGASEALAALRYRYRSGDVLGVHDVGTVLAELRALGTDVLEAQRHVPETAADVEDRADDAQVLADRFGSTELRVVSTAEDLARNEYRVLVTAPHSDPVVVVGPHDEVATLFHAGDIVGAQRLILDRLAAGSPASTAARREAETEREARAMVEAGEGFGPEDAPTDEEWDRLVGAAVGRGLAHAGAFRLPPRDGAAAAAAGVPFPPDRTHPYLDPTRSPATLGDAMRLIGRYTESEGGDSPETRQARTDLFDAYGTWCQLDRPETEAPALTPEQTARFGAAVDRGLAARSAESLRDHAGDDLGPVTRDPDGWRPGRPHAVAHLLLACPGRRLPALGEWLHDNTAPEVPR